MNEGSARIIAVRLKVARVGPEPDGRLDLNCMGCGAPMEVHQPDQEYPDRLLGTCDGCHGWVIADFASEGDGGVMVFLPRGDVFRCIGLSLDGFA